MTQPLHQGGLGVAWHKSEKEGAAGAGDVAAFGAVWAFENGVSGRGIDGLASERMPPFWSLGGDAAKGDGGNGDSDGSIGTGWIAGVRGGGGLAMSGGGWSEGV